MAIVDSVSIFDWFNPSACVCVTHIVLACGELGFQVTYFDR